MKKLIVTFIFLLSLFFSTSCFSENVNSRTERIHTFVGELNHGAAASYCNVTFDCFNCEDEKPVLIIKTTVNCLECEECFFKMNGILGISLLMISDIWYEHFGTRRTNIFNEVNRLSFIISEDRELMRPLPLPKEQS